MTAVVQSTFTAFISMLAELWGAFLLPLEGGQAQRSLYKRTILQISIRLQLLLKPLRKPFLCIITGSAVQALFQLIDQWTFIRTMEKFTSYSNSQLQVLYAYLSSNPSKITMILIAVTISPLLKLGFHS